jgi:hypothetical protein
MPRHPLLTDTKVRRLRAFDGGGRFLFVHPKSGKWWRFRYQFAGKTNTLSFRTYPEITLKEARNTRDEARRLLANGTDPSEDRKEQKRSILAKATTE